MVGVDRPYKRTVRQLADGSYADSGNGRYVTHPGYAENAERYVHAYLLILKDFISLTDYISNADLNEQTYSHRTHELLVRVCIEVEANFKAILKENGYKRKIQGVRDFYKVDATHKLSDYRVKVPYWDGENGIRWPFKEFKNTDENCISPHWYRAYNKAKHDRHTAFQAANFGALVDALAGLSALLAAQFRDEDFSPRDSCLAISGYSKDNSEEAIGGYFRIIYPDNWPQNERYNFDWQKLEQNAPEFGMHSYEKT